MATIYIPRGMGDPYKTHLVKPIKATTALNTVEGVSDYGASNAKCFSTVCVI